MQSFDPYKSAEALGIREDERNGLINLARELADPDYVERFDMAGWSNCAHAKLEAKIGRSVDILPMQRLFCGMKPYWQKEGVTRRTPAEASEAIYRFLTGVGF